MEDTEKRVGHIADWDMLCWPQPQPVPTWTFVVKHPLLPTECAERLAGMADPTITVEYNGIVDQTTDAESFTESLGHE